MRTTRMEKNLSKDEKFQIFLKESGWGGWINQEFGINLYTPQ